jgi:hypothetical protein
MEDEKLSVKIMRGVIEFVFVGAIMMLLFKLFLILFM